MKTKAFFICMMLFWVVTSDLPSGFAQEFALSAPNARLGEKYRCSNLEGAVKSKDPTKWLITPVNYLWDFDYSPDSRFWVVADSYAYEGITLYDYPFEGITTDNFRADHKLRGGAAWSRIRNVVFSPDGRTIVVGREDGDIFLIDTATLSASPAKHRPRAPLSTANLSIAWLSPDRSTLAWVRGRGVNASSLHLSDLQGGSRRTISGHTKETKDGFPFILSVGFDSRTQTLASASQDGIIHLWDANDGSHLQKFTQYSFFDMSDPDDPFQHVVVIYEVGVDPNPNNNHTREYWRTRSPNLNPPGDAFTPRAVLALMDTPTPEDFYNLPLDSVQNPANIIHFRDIPWNPDENKWEKYDILKHTFQGHTGCVWNVVYGTDGEEVASASVDGTIRTWDVETGVGKVHASQTLHFSNIAFSPNGKALAVGGNNGTIQLQVNGTWWPAFKAHDGPITSVAFHPWWEPFKAYAGTDKSVDHPATPTLASAGTDGTVRLWHLHLETKKVSPRVNPWIFYLKYLRKEVPSSPVPPPKTPETLTPETPETFHANALVLDEDFKRVSISWDPLIDVGELVTSVAFSPDGSALAIGSWNGVKVLKLWRVEQGAPVINYSAPVMSVAFSPDSQTLVAGCLDGVIRLGAVGPEGRTWAFKGHTDSVFKIKFGSNGRTFLSGSDDGTVNLWIHNPSPSWDPSHNEAPYPFNPPTLAGVNADGDEPSPQEDAATPEDINGDSVVNVQDLVLVSANMGATGENPADVNGDGVVNIQDLVLVANALGETP